MGPYSFRGIVHSKCCTPAYLLLPKTHAKINVKWNYEILDKKLFAIKSAFEEWHHHLEGAQNPVQVFSDQQPDQMRARTNMKCSIKDGIFYPDGRIYVPEGYPRLEVLHLCHVTLLAGYFGHLKTFCMAFCFFWESQKILVTCVHIPICLFRSPSVP